MVSEISEFLENSYENLKNKIRKEGIIIIEENRSSNFSDKAILDANLIIMNLNYKTEAKKVYRLSHEYGHFLDTENKQKGNVLGFSLSLDTDIEKSAHMRAILTLADDYYDIDQGGYYNGTKIMDFIELYRISELGIEKIFDLFKEYRSEYFLNNDFN